jgi:hypothetical protein
VCANARRDAERRTGSSLKRAVIVSAPRELVDDEVALVTARARMHAHEQHRARAVEISPARARRKKNLSRIERS